MGGFLSGIALIGTRYLPKTVSKSSTVQIGRISLSLIALRVGEGFRSLFGGLRGLLLDYLSQAAFLDSN